MWANRLVSRSGRPFTRTSRQQLAVVLGGVDSHSVAREFSDEQRGSGGRDDRKGKSGRGGSGNKSKKLGYHKTFLEPAARGELKNHKSTVPKLTGRKAKGQGVRGADDFPDDEEYEFDLQEDIDLDDFGTRPQTEASNIGTIAENSPPDKLSVDEYEALQAFMEDYQMLLNSEEEEKYYWSETDYDDAREAEKALLFEKLRGEATRDADGNLVVEVDDETFAMFDGVDEDAEESRTQETTPTEKPQAGLYSPGDDPAFQFVTEAMGVKSAEKPPPPDYDRSLPLQLQGPTMQDFVQSMMDHPVKYGEVRWEAPNPGSDREPVPEFDDGRKNPSEEFVSANKRFMYIWGLPQLNSSGEEADIDNPVQELEIQNLVSELFELTPDQVSVASPTSAFVGFSSIDDFKFAAAVGPKSKFVASPVLISQYTANGDFPLAKDHADSLVLLRNLPHGLTPQDLAASLFPSDSDVGSVYGNISTDKIVMLSPNSAVLAMESAEMAENAATSGLVEERLTAFGQHPVRYAKARREMVFTGTHGGPDGTDRLRTQGTRLIVDGDMPTKSFYLSHTGTLLLQDLDRSVSKEEIAAFFQPYCSVPRDVDGSTEFVTCRDGLRTNKVYVGFDEAGELEAAMEALVNGDGVLSGLGANPVTAKPIRDLDYKQRPVSRPTRSEESLLDSLNNWEQFVDPADMQELMDHGISKEALAEALRSIRHGNTTFASMDQSMRSETLNSDHEAGGMYKELVQTYVATLKECLSTPENPGAVYESFFYPGEDVDTEIFDMEAERLEGLSKRREAPWKNQQ